jgi:type I restriction enzyme M protein
LASMDPATGRSATLWPHGILFRTPEVRKAILEEDLIEAVIGLGPDLFYNSPMESCVVICRSKKAPDRQGKVLLVDASKDYVKRGKQSELTEGHQRKIADTYLSFGDQEGYSKVIMVDDALANGGSLAISLYIETAKAELQSLEHTVSVWTAAREDLRRVRGTLS